MHWVHLSFGNMLNMQFAAGVCGAWCRVYYAKHSYSTVSELISTFAEHLAVMLLQHLDEWQWLHQIVTPRLLQELPPQAAPQFIQLYLHSKVV